MTETNAKVTQYVVTDAAVPDGQVVFTPAGFKDIAIQAITPFALIVLRGCYAYGSAFLGLLLGSVGANAMGLPVFHATSTKGLLLTCASMAAATTSVSMLRNIASQWTALGEKFPILKA